MNNLLGQTCGNCGGRNNRDAAHCQNCGAALAGGTVVCGNCSTVNAASANYCKKCGYALQGSAAPQMRSQRWSRHPDEFAVRVEVDDVRRLFNSPLVVEAGTNAIFLEGGRSLGVLPPGEYTLDTFVDRLKAFVGLQAPNRATVILVSVAPFDLEFNLGGLPTASGLRVGLTCRLAVEVSNPVLFWTTLMGSRQRLQASDLIAYFSAEVDNAASEWTRRQKIEALATDLRLKQELELALDQHLRASFERAGLKFLNLRTLNFNTEHIDRLQGLRNRYLLQISEKEAELEGKARLADVLHQLNLQQLAEDAQKVDLEERKADLYRRMRQAVLSNKMDEVRSSADFERFLDEIDHDKLLREREKAELQRTWREAAEDRDRARAHLLAKLELEQQYELRAAELKLRQGLSTQELQGELELERLRVSKQLELESQRWDFELRRRKAEAELDEQQAEALRRQQELEQQSRLTMAATSHDEEMRQLDKELELGLKGLRGIKQARVEAERGQWQLERERREFEWAQQQRQIEVDLQRERIRMEHELNRLDKLGQLGTEALIAASGVEQGRILADLKKNEALKGMTEEQILAAAAERSPEVARALQEKYRAIAEGKTSQEVAQMYERLLAEKESAARQAREDADRRAHDTAEAWDKASARSQAMAERALDRMADTAQAFARGPSSGNPPVIVVGGNSPAQTYPSGSLAADMGAGSSETKTCPKCGRLSGAEARFCRHCGNKFEGI
jgi:hypothetical protein